MSGIPLPQEIPDIFIPPTPIGNAGVMRGRNENSGMTTVMTTGGKIPPKIFFQKLGFCGGKMI